MAKKTVRTFDDMIRFRLELNAWERGEIDDFSWEPMPLGRTLDLIVEEVVAVRRIAKQALSQQALKP